VKPVVLGRAPEGGPGEDPSRGALAPGRPLGVYVHFPFCGVRCPYCDFAVDTRAEIPHDAYADAVLDELAARRAWFDGAGPLALIAPPPDRTWAYVSFGAGAAGLPTATINRRAWLKSFTAGKRPRSAKVLR